jgi:hypothetical protein
LEKEPSERSAFLMVACVEEPELRREVETARDTKLRREVAIKVLPREFQNDPSRLARFEREAQVLASLNHPNIGAIYGLEEAEGIQFLVLELVEGPTLAEQIACGPMKVTDALPIATQIATALKAAHEKGVIHRDLKPANLKITPGGDVKVLDFGLAAVAPAFVDEPTIGSDVSESKDLTEPGMVLGTAAYMSPEQANRQSVDQRTDIWAFGVLLFEMLIGAQPFMGGTTADVLASVVHNEPDWKRPPRRVRPLLRACLQKDPEQRPSDFCEIKRLLEAIPVGMSRKRGLQWAVVAILILGLAAFWMPRMSRDHRMLRPVTSVSGVVTYGRPVGRAFAFSPDGRALAVRAPAKNGEPTLWVWNLDENSPTAFPGVRFWAP